MLTLTKAHLDSCKTAAGGYTRATMEALGLTYPPEKNWPRKLLGTSVSSDTLQKAIDGSKIRVKRPTPATAKQLHAKPLPLDLYQGSSVLTEELLASLVTAAGGLTTAQLKLLGEPRLKEGWREHILGKSFPNSTLAKVRAAGRGGLSAVQVVSDSKNEIRKRQARELPEQLSSLVHALLEREVNQKLPPLERIADAVYLLKQFRKDYEGTSGPEAQRKLFQELRRRTHDRFPKTGNKLVLAATCAELVAELRLFGKVLSIADVVKHAQAKEKDGRYILLLSNLKYSRLQHVGRFCAACGPSWERKEGVTIELDHIDPVSHSPHLALDYLNTQLLCSECNSGKSNLDWEPCAPKELR